VILTNVALLLTELREAYRAAVDAAHHDTPHPVTYVRNGRPGRPRAVIDSEWLAWAQGHRSTSEIGRYLGLSRQTVQDALLNLGLREPQEAPFVRTLVGSSSDAPSNPTGMCLSRAATGLGLALYLSDLPAGISLVEPSIRYTQVHSYTTRVSVLTDDELDGAIIRLRLQFPNAGVNMLHGSLTALGHNVPKTRITASLMRIDPVRAVFERHIIRRRRYSVPGPNSLWHHDGQHGNDFLHFSSTYMTWTDPVPQV
jgi:hypothetical protein